MKVTKNIFLPSLAEMIFISIFLFLSLGKGSGLLSDGDTGYHIRAGEWILDNLAIPRHDIFSLHNPPLSWTAHEWLSEVIMALIHHVSGLTGTVVFFSFILAFVFYLLFRIVRNAGGNILITVLVTLLAVAASKIHWLARPHVFSLLLFLVWYRILDVYRHGDKNRLYLLPPMMLLWVNLHGGYLAGFVLLGVFMLSELPDCFSKAKEMRVPARRRMQNFLIVLGVCLPVSCINPYGYHILLFPFNLVTNKMLMNNVSEFLSPNFHEPSPFKYIILSLIAVIALSKERLRLAELLLLLVFLNMSLYSVRYIPLFAIVSAPIIVRLAETLFRNSDNRLSSLFAEKSDNIAEIDASSGGVLWAVVACVVVAWCTASGTVRYGFEPESKPVAALQFIEKANLQGNMFNNDEFGDYVIYAAWPRYKVYYDGRIDMYGTSMLKEYMKVINFEDGWENILEKHRVNWIFFNADSRLSRFLRERKDWVLIYKDKVACIFIKNAPQNRNVINKYEIVTGNR